MNREEMKQLILEAVSARLGNGYNGILKEVLKTNVKLEGLTIFQAGNNVAPTIYLDSFYEALEKGATIDEVADRILKLYLDTKGYPLQVDTKSILDFNCIKDRLYVGLINRHLNKELLQDIPHAPFLDDFASVIRCTVDIVEDQNASFLVHNSHINMWQTDQETLMSHALQNMRESLGVKLENMKNIIKELNPNLADNNSPDAPIWVMTNNRHYQGAATALFEDVLQNFAKGHGNFYAIFSSVHEILLVPTPDNSDIDNITRMNRDVNATRVQADEILGTKAYYYQKGSGFILG